jgi:hypothetical protein
MNTGYWIALTIGISYVVFWIGAAYGYYRPWEDALDRSEADR